MLRPKPRLKNLHLHRHPHTADNKKSAFVVFVAAVDLDTISSFLIG